MTILAYQYDADVHCPPCTFSHFGRPDTGAELPGDLRDAEGNHIGAIFTTDEWWDPSVDWCQNLDCGDCNTDLAHRCGRYPDPEEMPDERGDADCDCDDCAAAAEYEGGDC